jgi:hypothetical protein
MKKPLGPEDVVEALRERIKREDLTLTASEAGRIIWMLERLSQRCAEAYQVVGSLAGLAELECGPAVFCRSSRRGTGSAQFPSAGPKQNRYRRPQARNFLVKAGLRAHPALPDGAGRTRLYSRRKWRSPSPAFALLRRVAALRVTIRCAKI